MGLEVIQELKKKKGFTTETLSKASGIPIGTLNKILNGDTKDPRLETMKTLARVLGCTLDDFDDENKKEKLTENESELLAYFKQLNQENQSRALRLIKSLIDSQEVDEILERVDEAKESTDTV